VFRKHIYIQHVYTVSFAMSNVFNIFPSLKLIQNYHPLNLRALQVYYNHYYVYQVQ